MQKKCLRTRLVRTGMIIAFFVLPSDDLVAQQSERTICEPAVRAFDAPAGAFDFLVGEWSVLEGDDEVVRVSVTQVFDKKALSLNWEATVGGPWEGHAYLGLDETGGWSQVWADSSSTPRFLFYHGGIEDGVPVLYMTEQYHEPQYGPADGGAFVCGRHRFMDLADGTFTYTWELSIDQGQSWGIHDAVTFRRR